MFFKISKALVLSRPRFQELSRQAGANLNVYMQRLLNISTSMFSSLTKPLVLTSLVSFTLLIWISFVYPFWLMILLMTFITKVLIVFQITLLYHFPSFAIFLKYSISRWNNALAFYFFIYSKTFPKRPHEVFIPHYSWNVPDFLDFNGEDMLTTFEKISLSLHIPFEQYISPFIDLVDNKDVLLKIQNDIY